jgi:hypothetical protein
MLEAVFKSVTDNLGAALNALTPKITIPFAATGWLLIYVNSTGKISLTPPEVMVALVVAILCTGLATVGMVAGLWTAAQPFRVSVARRLWLRREQQRVEAELEFLQPKERLILACLLAKNQKTIEVQPDGEEAATLIAKGFLVLPPRRPLAIHRDICLEIPPHAWNVLTAHRDQFPFNEAVDPPNPWRTHWMAR